MTPATEALAFRVWAAASSEEWNVTPDDLARTLRTSKWRVSYVLRVKGWGWRLRPPCKARRLYADEDDRDAIRDHVANHGGYTA